MAWKYIMLEIELTAGSPEDEPLKVAFPVIFPDKMVHLEVATVMKLVGPLDGNNPRVASAGTIEHLVPLGLGGESTTLRVKSRPELDSAIVKQYTYGHGIVVT